ncbi:hypothetical protein DRE_01897 [Drechslerella stenobrocha 248]|uniref:Uncharacterized protein n=1 Tax=Drechslerella stenobrocha 248 TaxID=1043628 RepID=W7IHF4_9PEZI|nr:hypothetical protein DRE_01897 [Drechslerella stenobrocha 248]
MARFSDELTRWQRDMRGPHINTSCDYMGFSANLISPALPQPENFLKYIALSQRLVRRRYTHRPNIPSCHDLWAYQSVSGYFIPPQLSPVPGDACYDQEDRKDAAEEPISNADRKAIRALSDRRRGVHGQYYRRNGGIHLESFPVRLTGLLKDRIDVMPTFLDRSGKNAMMVTKYSKSRTAMVDLAVMIEIPGPGSQTWEKEGGGGWWGTARETERLLAVTCRLRMQGAGNGLGVFFGLVTGGTRVRFFKWTNDGNEATGGKLEDLAVVLGLVDDEEDYDSDEDEDGEMPDAPESPLIGGNTEHEDYDSSSGALNKGKGRMETTSPQQDPGDQDASHLMTDPTGKPPAHHTSQPFVPDPEDIFDIRLPPETARGGYYDMLWQGDKCNTMFHYIGGYQVD